MPSDDGAPSGRQRHVLPMPDRTSTGLITFDATDPAFEATLARMDADDLASA